MAELITTRLDLETNIQEAKKAVSAYRATCDGLYKQLKATIDNLVQQGFIGDASQGYIMFINTVTPRLTSMLTAPDNSVTSMLENLLDAVSQLLNPVDVNLKNANANAADSTAAN